MAATTIVTRNVPDRFRGFLASCACEVAPGVYVAPKMNRAVRERVWHVMGRWFPLGANFSILMTWPNKAAPGGLSILTLGTPAYDVVDHYDCSIVRTDLDGDEKCSLKIEDENIPF